MTPLTSPSALSHSNPSVSVRDLSVNYGPVRALTGATFDLYPGRVCALVGTNGSGKSTLFKSMLGIVKAQSGQVQILGLDPAQARKQALLSYVPQSEDVDWSFPLRVKDVVLMGRYRTMGFFRRPSSQDRQAVAEALERVDLSDLGDRQIGALSGGQRKRAFVARGLAQGAQVLFLDEPFSGVDRNSQGTITRLLKSLAQQGATVLVSTHDLESLPELASEALLIQKRILMHDRIETVLRPENLSLAFGAAETAPDSAPEVVPHSATETAPDSVAQKELTNV
ncbi:ABC transporter [Boudabousia liubingyangii]|uniref:metal ABC transporter ATP-binding protein n=1 Tax=Boudabousia liubingyangii TaxID=1921764 RepID=UPI00093C2D3D|nr:metal ABC transporter ATP-binding protein [Boudabousia liubingyangii]OKL47502.1 ABC transporter [Boudabousia liubingyangii]